MRSFFLFIRTIYCDDDDADLGGDGGHGVSLLLGFYDIGTSVSMLYQQVFAKESGWRGSNYYYCNEVSGVWIIVFSCSSAGGTMTCLQVMMSELQQGFHVAE